MLPWKRAIATLNNISISNTLNGDPETYLKTVTEYKLLD